MKRGFFFLGSMGVLIVCYGCGGESESTQPKDAAAQDLGLPDGGAPSGSTPCLNDDHCDGATEVCRIADGARVGECVLLAGAHDGGMTDAGDGADAGADADAQACVPTRDAGALYREPEPEPPPPEAVPASSVVREAAIIAYWPLDGDFSDHLGTHNLLPNSEDGFGEAPYVRGPTNLSYGPTGQTEDNGARLAEAMEIDQAAGLSMEGWIRVRGNSTSGVIFGFGESGYQEPKLQVSLSWGFVTVSMGRVAERKSVRFERIGQSGCWRHIAVVFPPNFISNPGQSFQLYIDGEGAQPVDEEADTAMVGTEFFGGPFRLGEFTGDQGGHIQLDEVRIYDTVLLGREIRRLAESRGFGEACPGPDPPEWAPPERCSSTDGDIPVEVDLGLRVVSPNTVVLITDPNRWMKEKIQTDCGAYLRAMADAEVSGHKEYFYAAMETFEHYRPLIARSVYDEGHFRVGRLSGGQCEEVVAHTQSCWPQGIREFYVPHAVAEERAVWTHRGEIVYFTYLTLDEALVDGEDYVFVDRWGHRAQLSYTANEEVSWAIKVNQVGYPTVGPKFGYAGFWLPGVGPLDLSVFDETTFEVRRTDNHAVVHTGAVAHRGFTQIPNEDPDAVPVNPEGEIVYEMDFSELEEAGEYYVYVPDLGRSWPFRIGAGAMGESYYVHARGLFHQRCAPLDRTHTPWARGDIHGTYRGRYPPIDNAGRYVAVDQAADHSAEGWGFLDAEGNYAAEPRGFDLIELTRTEQLLPDGGGGWHDAADFDRRPQHLEIVTNLAQTYLFFPMNFSDGQLNIPESGNGVPDMVDQAVWGVDFLRRLQGADGSATTKVEATSHPKQSDPGLDMQPYYAAMATRSSSLCYSKYAAVVSRALVEAGAPEQARVFRDSAESAWRFGRDPNVRVSTEFTNDAGDVIRWIEAPSPHPRRVLLAAVQLWLATGEQTYLDALDSPDLVAAFDSEVGEMQARLSVLEMAAIAQHPEGFPEGWGERVQTRIVADADAIVDAVNTHAYRRVHAAPDSNRFYTAAWGSHQALRQIAPLVAAFGLTGDLRYRGALVHYLDWFHGANPQGRSYTTGLGHYATANLLHLPADVDGIDEPPPGVTPFLLTTGNAYQNRTHLHGLYEGGSDRYRYEGVGIPLMPPPYDEADADLSRIGEVINPMIPFWRRYLPLEHVLVSTNEYTVRSTIQLKVIAAGVLLSPGWSPSDRLLNREPYGPERYQQDLWLLP